MDTPPRPILKRKRPNAQSQYTGVSQDKYGRFKALILRKGKRWDLGYFETEEDAAMEYDLARIYLGSAPINFQWPTYINKKLKSFPPLGIMQEGEPKKFRGIYQTKNQWRGDLNIRLAKGDSVVWYLGCFYSEEKALQERDAAVRYVSGALPKVAKRYPPQTPPLEGHKFQNPIPPRIRETVERWERTKPPSESK